MKLLLLLSAWLGLTWTLQDETLVPVQEDFRPEQVMLWGLWIRQGVTPCLQLFFQVSEPCRVLMATHSNGDQRSGILHEARDSETLCQVT